MSSSGSRNIGSVTLGLEYEMNRVRAHLEDIGAPVKGIIKRLLGVVARAAKKRVQTRMGAYLGEGEGKFFVVKSKKAPYGKRRWLTLRQRVYGYARSETHWVVAAPRYIAEPLEHGATLRPKRGKYISFVGEDGNYHKVKTARIPARRWFTRSIAGFEESTDMERAIADAEKRWVEKWEREQRGDSE